MIVGVGLDVVAVAAIAENVGRDAYLRRVFTPAEIAACRASPRADERFAGKFAVKEALMKALGAGMRQGVLFTNIEVLNDEAGRPVISLTGEAARLAQSLGVVHIHASLSHSAGVAVGIAILEGNATG